MRSRNCLALAAVLLTLAALSPAAARADTFGCTVLLCMLNPQGWASVPHCVPPVQAAFAIVAKGRPWPQCPEANISAQPDTASESIDISGQSGRTRVPLGKSAAP
ncbi:hypothetical protein FHT98_5111 [Bosea sp. AK1]|nr:hypothetical protein FHT98_5111 [Bosea sp. AK1]